MKRVAGKWTLDWSVVSSAETVCFDRCRRWWGGWWRWWSMKSGCWLAKKWPGSTINTIVNGRVTGSDRDHGWDWGKVHNVGCGKGYLSGWSTLSERPWRRQKMPWKVTTVLGFDGDDCGDIKGWGGSRSIANHEVVMEVVVPWSKDD